MTRETAEQIEVTAALWAAKADRGLTWAEIAELDAWLVGDSRRLGAWARLRAVAVHTERARVLGGSLPSLAHRRSVAPTRRAMLAGGGALAAGLAGAVVLSPAKERVATRRGEIRVLVLADGSTVTLNTNSRIDVSYGEHRRTVFMLGGEALFDVAPDLARPFIVEAGKARAQALGTSFTVRRLRGEPVTVLVREGVVEVRHQDARERSVRAVAGARVTAEASPGVGTPALQLAAVPPAELERSLAWRDGRLAFEGATLAQAAAEFARYSDTRLVVEDAALAAEPIAGLYPANDPVGFARAVAVSLGLRLDIQKDEVRLRR